jgi:hypothetical protein
MGGTAGHTDRIDRSDGSAGAGRGGSHAPSHAAARLKGRRRRRRHLTTTPSTAGPECTACTAASATAAPSSPRRHSQSSHHSKGSGQAEQARGHGTGWVTSGVGGDGAGSGTAPGHQVAVGGLVCEGIDELHAGDGEKSYYGGQYCQSRPSSASVLNRHAAPLLSVPWTRPAGVWFQRDAGAMT